MVLAHLLIFLPAFALSSKDSVSIVPAEDLKVCEYFDARIIRLGEIINEELRPDVDVHSDLYITLEESKLCDTVGYVAIPQCVANNEGDECIARKTSELIRKSLRAAMKAEKIKDLPSGEKFFATCKHIGYKNVLKTFKSARSLMSAECGLPGQKHGNRHARNADLLPALLLAGSYDPSSIWFQYFLCKDIDLYCYFFTQGWTQGQYGQYFLYENLLDGTNGLFKGSSDSNNLATIALLGGLGGGIGQPSGYYPSYGAHAAPAQGRKRREPEEDNEERKRRSEYCDKTPNAQECLDRKRRSVSSVDCNETPEARECLDRKRRSVNSVDCDKTPNARECHDRNRRSDNSVDCDETPNARECFDRKRRSANTVDCDETPNARECLDRKRRSVSSVDCKKTPNDQVCLDRKRRSVSPVDCTEDDDGSCRERRQACEACEINPDSTECNICLGIN